MQVLEFTFSRSPIKDPAIWQSFARHITPANLTPQALKDITEKSASNIDKILALEELSIRLGRTRAS